MAILEQVTAQCNIFYSITAANSQSLTPIFLEFNDFIS